MPLVSFEGACGQTDAAGRRALARGGLPLPWAASVEAGYFGLVSKAFRNWCASAPMWCDRIIRAGFRERTPVICQVRMLNETPLVPDIERLEVMIAEETRAA